jgi:hypothetical protein
MQIEYKIFDLVEKFIIQMRFLSILYQFNNIHKHISSLMEISGQNLMSHADERKFISNPGGPTLSLLKWPYI